MPASNTARLRLWVLTGGSPMVDIGSLQAFCGRETLFQAASQFNCLEAPGPHITEVREYFDDPTQGPRASISAFPATLLRHYAAPGPKSERFTQQSDGRQVELLANACGAGAAPNGYFTGEVGVNLQSLISALEDRFEAIRIGVHDGVQVILGGNWDGGVPDSEHFRIAQVFTSTVAGGMYGGRKILGEERFSIACRQLLRAAYLGTLLAAASLGRDRVVLTLIGGGVFGNSIPDIWQAIQWAMDQAEPVLSRDMNVFLNGWHLGAMIDLQSHVLPVVRARDGAIVTFQVDGSVAVVR